MVKIGIIGGSGFDNPQILKESKELYVGTKYGQPSSPLKIGKISNIDVVLLARHGRGHSITPTNTNNKANITSLKEQGCTHIIATTACGSLREEIERGDLVILDQFIDFTKKRNLTFFDNFPGRGGENAQHIAMPDPFSKNLRNIFIKKCKELNLKHHKKGTVITIEGPRFSTRAESNMYRIFGADVVNMSIAPECALSNEAGIPYAAVAISTDYDSWKENEIDVTWEEILDTFGKNVKNVIKLIVEIIPEIEKCQK